MKARNATKREVTEAVEKTWSASRGKAELIQNMEKLIKAVKLVLDPFKCSKVRIENEIDQLVLKIQEMIINRAEWRERADEDQSFLDATTKIWNYDMKLSGY